MDDAKYGIHIHGSVQWLTIGDHASGNAHFSPSSSAHISSSTVSYRSIFGTPPQTDPSIIQQRTTAVEAIITELTQASLNALALTGIGGVGKSTLAALVYQAIAVQHQQATSPFAEPPLWLTVDALTAFTDIMGTIYQALGKPLPDLRSLSPANQAHALCMQLSTAPSRLIVLDQFDEYLLDWKTGEVLPDRHGIGEWLDALNSQPWSSGCRLLLTSRSRPKGIHAYAPLGLQGYAVEGLSIEEGIDLLGKRGVQAEQADLRKAVVYCHGHALALTLLIVLVQEYSMPLADLLSDSSLWFGDIATKLLDEIFQRLSDDQRDLLRAFSLYRTAVPIEAAQAIFPGVSRQALLIALRPLLTQHLIQSIPEKSYQLHAIVASYSKQHFVGGDERENLQSLEQAHAKAAQYCSQQAQQQHPPCEQRKHVSDVFWIVEAVWQLMQAAQWQEAYTLIGQEELASDLDLWGNSTLLLEEIIQPFLSQKVWQLAPEQRANIFIGVGTSYGSLGKIQEALDYFEQALVISREVGNGSMEGTTLNNLGQLYNALGKMQEALDYFEQALVISREVGNRPMEGTTLNNLGMVYSNLGKMQEALDYYEQALVISREVGNRPGEGSTLNNLGLVYNALGKMQEALDYFEQALVISREVGNRPMEGTTLNNLGLVYNALGKRQEALDYFEQALVIHREVGNRPVEGATLNNLGQLYNDLGKMQEALDYYQQALVIHREVGNRPVEGTTLNNLGGVYNNLGKMQEALDYFEQALVIHREVGNRSMEGTTLTNLGGVYNNLGKMQEALDYFEQALVIHREVSNRSVEGTTLNNLGMVYDNLGKMQEALDYFEQALVIHREVGNRSMEGTTLNNLGMVYDNLGKMQEALDYFEQALVISRDVGNRPMEGTTLNNLGSIYQALGKMQEALDYYEQALVISRDVGNRPVEGVTLHNIGTLFFSQQCYEAALAGFLLAQSIFEEVLSPHRDVAQRWIDDLREKFGDEAFAALQARVEPQAEQILEQVLRQGMDRK
jgi:tetratricopeptide (TPR) repeat protein